VSHSDSIKWNRPGPLISPSTSGVYWLVLFFFMEETRGTVLLIRQATLLRKEFGDHRHRARIEDASWTVPFPQYNVLNRDAHAGKNQFERIDLDLVHTPNL
jgi:hypothetical protein